MAIFLLGMVFSAGPNAFASGRLAGDTAARETLPVIPARLQQKLDSLKQADQLEEWMNAWYDHLASDPGSHFGELTIPLKAIWREPRTDPENVSWFYLLIFMGYYELQQGDILQSTDIYERAYRLVQHSDAIHDNEILEYLIKPLGNNYTRLGDYERAFFIQKEGLRLAGNLKDPMQEAAALANMSTTARWNGRPEAALKYAGEGLKKVKKGTALQGLLYSTRADILQDMGSIDSAQLAVKKTLRLFSKRSFREGANNAYWYAGSLTTAGEIAQKEQRYDKAEQLFDRALHVFQLYFPQSRQREKMKLQVALGQVNMRKGDMGKALISFNDALSGLLPQYNKALVWPEDTALYAENTLLDALTGKAWLLHLTGNDSLALQGYQKAAVVLQKLRRTIFSREAKRLLQQQGLQTTEKAITLAYRLFKNTGNDRYARAALQFAEEHKARLLLDDLQKNRTYMQRQRKDSLFIRQSRLHQAIAFYTHAYMDAMQQDHPTDSLHWKQKIDEGRYELSLLDQRVKDKYPAMRWGQAIDIKKLPANLPSGMITWEYFTGPQKWYGFAVSSRGIEQFAYLGSAGNLKEKAWQFVRHWFMKGPGNMINQPAVYCKQAYYLYEKLRLGSLDGHPELLIIPDGILGRLPFEALVTDTGYRPNPGDWPYLLSKAVTSQAYSLGVWSHSQKEFSKPDDRKGFAGFFISPGENSPLATLEGVEREADSIHHLISGRCFKNEEATAGEFLRSLQKNEVIHISTHAFLIGGKQIPALQMADKKILLADLYPLHVHPALVVISACQTANGLLSPGEGIISLAREFTAMGAGGVISALWNINDETAAKLTSLFYQKLKQTGDKASALYQAKKEWLKQDQPDAASKLPYYWAGLLYYGNNVPLEYALKPPSAFPVWGWGLIVVILLSLGWYGRKYLGKTEIPGQKCST